MEKLPQEKIELMIRLRREGLTLEAIKRVTGIDKRVQRKYFAQECMYVTDPYCACKPGMYIMPCPSPDCNMSKRDEEEEVSP